MKHFRFEMNRRYTLVHYQRTGVVRRVHLW